MESFIINVSYAGHTLIRNDGLAIYKHQILWAGNEMQSKQANRPKSDISCNFVIVYLLLAKQKLFPAELNNAVGFVRKRQKHCSSYHWVWSYTFLVWKKKKKFYLHLSAVAGEYIHQISPTENFMEFLQKNNIKESTEDVVAIFWQWTEEKSTQRCLDIFSINFIGFLHLL